MKLNPKNIFKKVLLLLLYSIIFLCIGYGIAILISHLCDRKLQDVMGYEGLIVLLIGVFACMKGNPSNVIPQASGGKNVQYSTYQNLEITRLERESTDYYNNFTKHSIVEFSIIRIAILIAGLLILMISLFV